MAALGTRLLTLTVNAVEFTAQVSNVRIVSGEADSDFVSFADAAAGGAREYKLAFTAVQDPATGTLWDKVWTGAGTTVPFILKPAGGDTTPTPAQPHFTGNAVVTEPDGDLLGGEADASSSARFTFECEWTCTAKPVRLTT
ncbi:MAG: hypothetical protein P1U38_09850 [Aeromicrobium sp.]|uniref:hypothetical protein n=1 Tax=Aeromicrobium sp. TaxID=1871063 RepID=UPI00261FE5C0|nr:hypothetical protein [Aeromicrobium sp.]MDF1705065.1 hypothetical protein [Aeromicrobium sp.]